MEIVKLPAAGVALFAAALLAGCGASAAGDNQPTGTVHGMITLTGGPRGASPVGAAGTVIAKRSGKQVARQDVADGQQFSFQLPAGKYVLSAGGGLPCEDATVTVTAGADQSVALICSRK